MKPAIVLAVLSVLAAVGTMFAILGGMLLAKSLETNNPPAESAGEKLRGKT